MHDEQYRSDQLVLLVVPFELEFCLVYGAADSLLNMALHDVLTGKLQVVDILNRRRDADNCVRRLPYFFASLVILASIAFLYLQRHSNSSCVPSRSFWTMYKSLTAVRQGARVTSTDVPGMPLTCDVPNM